MLVSIVGFFFLKVSGIGQQNSGQVNSGGCCEDRTFITVRDEPRQITGVIDVRVCEYDRVDRFWIDRRRFPVPQSQFFRTLKKTAIKKNPAVLRLDQKFGTGNSLSRAQKSKLHNRLGYVSVVPSAFTNLVNVCSSIFVAVKM